MPLDESFGGEQHQAPLDCRPIVIADRGNQLQPARSLDLAQPIEDPAAKPARARLERSRPLSSTARDTIASSLDRRTGL